MPYDSLTQMSARLDDLVEFTLNEKDAKLAEALIKHGMEGHAKRMGLISSDYVSAPSAQAKVQEAIKKMKRPASSSYPDEAAVLDSHEPTGYSDTIKDGKRYLRSGNLGDIGLR